MPEENLLAVLEGSLREARSTRSRLASRLADIEAEGERVRAQVNEMDSIVSQTEAAMFRILTSALGGSAATRPSDAEIEAALRRDAEAERRSVEGHDAGRAPQPFDRTPVEPVRPPARAQAFLCLLLDAKDQKAVVGDLIERYEVVVNRRGKRRADLWFHYEVARSTWPFLRKMIAKVRGRINSRSASA